MAKSGRRGDEKWDRCFYCVISFYDSIFWSWFEFSLLLMKSVFVWTSEIAVNVGLKRKTDVQSKENSRQVQLHQLALASELDKHDMVLGIRVGRA